MQLRAFPFEQTLHLHTWAALLALSLAAAACAPANGTITGVVHTSSGAPAAAVRVALEPEKPQKQPLPATETDSAGHYRVEVPPGRYRVAAGPRNHPVHFPQMVEVASNATTSGIDLTLERARIRGRVSHIPEGTPPGLLRVEMLSKEPPREAEVQPDGAFEFLDVAPGWRRIHLQPLPGNVDVTVSDADLDDVKLVPAYVDAPGATRFLGRVRIEGGGRFPGDDPDSPAGVFRLLVKGPEGSANSSFVRSDGVLGVAYLPDGEYQVRAVKLPAGYSVKSMTYGGVNLLAEPLRVTSTGKDQFIEVMLTPSPTAPPPDPSSRGTLIVSKRGQGPDYIEGKLSFFVVRNKSLRLESRLGGEFCGTGYDYSSGAARSPSTSFCMSMGAKSFDSLAFSLPAGRYDIESYVSVCLGCGRGMHPQDKCGAAVEIAAGETLYAERIENGKECTVVTSSKPFR